MTAPLAPLRRQIIWSRLIAVVEEQARTLMRTAFSPTVREAGDLSAGVFDLRGRMVAQAVTGTPGHVNSLAAAAKHFLAARPPATLSPLRPAATSDSASASNLHSRSPPPANTVYRTAPMSATAVSPSRSGH